MVANTVLNAPTLKVTKTALNWFNSYLTRMHQEGIVCEKVTITPARAAVLLSMNVDNRALRNAKIAQLVTDLKEGNFQFNGEPIIVSSNGQLNDGQHRLFACIKSRVSFDTIIVFGTKRESRFTIDTGAARSASDHLSLEGISNASTAAAMARYILSFEREGSFSKRGTISSQEQILRVKDDHLIGSIAAWSDSRKNRMRSMMKASMAGFLYYLIAKKAPEEAKLFMEQLAIGAGLDAKSPVYLLREKLMHSPNLTEGMKAEAFVRAWNHFCNSPTTSISRLQIMGNIPEIAKPSWAIAPVTPSSDLVVVKSKRKAGAKV